MSAELSRTVPARGVPPAAVPVVRLQRLDLGAFDLYYAYPWPAEKRHLVGLFAAHAPAGARLVLFHGGSTWEVLARI